MASADFSFYDSAESIKCNSCLRRKCGKSVQVHFLRTQVLPFRVEPAATETFVLRAYHE